MFKRCALVHFLLSNQYKNITICGFDHSIVHFDNYVYNKAVPHDFEDEKRIMSDLVSNGHINKLY